MRTRSGRLWPVHCAWLAWVVKTKFIQVHFVILFFPLMPTVWLTRVLAGGTRRSQVLLMHPPNCVDGWVKHRENGVIYCLDVTKVMFSSGNGTEKQVLVSLMSSDLFVLGILCLLRWFRD
jgi:hypothetical protein